MTSGVPYSPGMRQYIADHVDTLFPAEIACRLREQYGTPVSRWGVARHVRRIKATRKTPEYMVKVDRKTGTVG